jgi:hypothetical protein
MPEWCRFRKKRLQDGQLAVPGPSNNALVLL